MSKKLLQAAAGAAAGEALYVEDVFSTYLYEGTGSSATATSTSSALGFGFTHNIQFSSDGLYVATHLPNSAVYIWSLSTPYKATTITTSTNFSFTSQTTNSASSRLSDDGTKAYVSDATTDVIFQYDLSTAYDASSASYASKSLDISGQVTNPRGFFFKPDGTSLFVVCANNDAIYQYTLSTAWDLSTGSYASKSVSTGGETNPYNVFFNNTGTVMIICGSANGLTEFALSTAWDVSTASATGTTGNPDTYGTTTLSFAADFADNGSRLVVIDSAQKIGVGDLITSYDIDTIGDGQIIRNSIDLDGEGGLVWTKNRNQPRNHNLVDTERGVGLRLKTNSTDAEYNEANGVTSFNSDGYSLSTATDYNANGDTYASWTFRKAPKFFDVVTYTGDGTAGRQISHNLGSTPGFFVVKRTDSADNWKCWHTSTGDGVTLELDGSGADTGENWPTGGFTSTYFTVNSGGSYNASGGTYVAYLFASDAGGFGDDDESIIKCGSFTGGTGGYATVNLGFEPQWIMIKGTTLSSQWVIYDTMRGWVVSDSSADDAYLFANLTNSEGLFAAGEPNATGFRLKDSSTAGETYIYIAIRRPMKTPESGTEVFAVDTADSTVEPYFVSNFVVDAVISRDNKNTTTNNRMTCRLTQARTLYTDVTNAESSNTNSMFDYMNGYRSGTGTDAQDIDWMFKRATGFFDVVAYSGDGTIGRVVNHNLGVKPELIISKARSRIDNWWVGQGFTSTQVDHLLLLQSSNGDAVSNDTYPAARYYNEPTSTSYTIVADNSINGTGETYIAYLFATLAGVSKVGSYTGTGSNINVDCGFSAGARFILIKRTDSTGDWYVWDSERGIVAGNDPYLLLNSTAAEVTSTDYIDPLSSGFTVTSSAPAALNASGGTYIYLAIS